MLPKNNLPNFGTNKIIELKHMILCSVCNTENDQYAINCIKCGSFLQNRVPNLDLFNTCWQVIEKPKIAFHIITLADHKNYSFLLFSIFGISLSFTEFWYFRLGDRFETLLSLIVYAIVIGVPIGIVLCPITSFIHWIYSKIFGSKAPFRASLGITSYSLTPIVISLLLVLPVELLTFGMYLFTFNPHPMTIKPLSYVSLIGFDTIVTLWTFILLVIGTHVGHQISIVKSGIITLLLVITILTGMLYGGTFLLKFI